MQLIAQSNGYISGDLSGAAVALLTIYPPPAGAADYLLVVRASSLNTGHHLAVMDFDGSSLIGVTTYTNAAAVVIAQQRYGINAAGSPVVVKLKDNAGLSDDAVWQWSLFRTDQTIVQQPDQLIPNGSTQPILFRSSASSVITPTVTISKNGAAFAAAAGTVAAISSGLWKLTPTAGDTSTNGPLVLKATWTTPATTPPSVYLETQIAHHFVFADAAAALETAFATAMAAALADLDLSAGFNRSGPGATEWTATVKASNGDPLQGARVWVTTDAEGVDTIAGYLTSDDDGECVFLLDQGGTYYLWAKHSGKMQIRGQQFTVT